MIKIEYMHTLTLTEQSKLLHEKKISSEELTKHYLNRIKALDSKYTSFINIFFEEALAQAKEADIKLTNKKATSPLTGIPIAHKDNLLTKGHLTTCASKMLHNFIAPYESTVTQKLLNAGTVLLGKTNMDEFSMGSSTENSYFGACKNPWDLSRVCGGSSGGSACAVAARLVCAATGSDTGGSIRQPASFCGVSGLKPTYGTVSRWGLIAFASSFDQVGPIGQSAQDLALLMNCIAGHDPKDSTSINRNYTDYAKELNEKLTGKKIGFLLDWIEQSCDDVKYALEKVADLLKAEGAEIVEIKLDAIEDALSTFYVLSSAEAASNLARYDGVRYGYRCKNPKNLSDLYKRSRSEGFGDEVKRRIIIGNYVLSAGCYDEYYVKAQKVRRLIKMGFDDALSKCDVLLGPTSPTISFGLGTKLNKPDAMYHSDIYTVGVNLAGLPALSVPCGFSKNKPIGMQLIGPYFKESLLLNIAHQYQKLTNWHLHVPKSALSFNS